MRYFLLIPVVLKQIIRQPLRSILTVAGICLSMFLFCAVEAMQAGVQQATEVQAGDTTLVVYRENRYCPFTSRLPQYYQDRIEAIDGVRSATPMKIQVSNCRASLDVVTFRGVPPENFLRGYADKLDVVQGSTSDWQRRTDAALVGESLAARRGIEVGDSFSAAGITVYVVGVVRSDEPQDQNVAYTHLSFLQEQSRKGGTGGIVTQFNVKVKDPLELASVAEAIDQEFSRESSPTSTRPEKAFVAHVANEILAIVGFASWLGWGALAALFALVANAIALAVQDRISEHAVLQTIGYAPGHIAFLVLAEGVLLALMGGTLGVIAALVFMSQHYALSTEGLNIEVALDPYVAAYGLLISVVLGIVAGLSPALRASRREISESFRAV